MPSPEPLPADPSPPPHQRWGGRWRRYVLPSGLRLLSGDETVRLMLLGVLIGVISGVCAWLFDLGMVGFGYLLLGTEEPYTNAPRALFLLLGPVAGGILAGLAIAYGVRDHFPRGIADVIDATWNHGGKMSFRNGLFTALAGSAVVGAGHSGGREGPIAQFAAAATSHLCRRLNIPPSRARVLVAAGAGAGIAASFNTPIAGAFFTMEIILGNFAMQMFGPVVAATVTGTMVGQALLGQRIALHLPTFTLHHPIELVLYLLLGALCGGVAVVFKRLCAWTDERLAKWQIHPGVRPVLGGLVVGVVSLAGLHQVMGNGYAWMEATVSGELDQSVPLLVLILVAKLVATVATASSRGGAGIFAPSLFLGAATGMLFGSVVHSAWPDITDPAGAYGMVGMGAVAAAVTHAPITMALMLFEMTRNYQIILPLLLCLAMAGIVGAIFESESEYIAVLLRRGTRIERRREELVMYELRVSDIQRTDDLVSITRRAPFRDLASLFLHNRVDEVFVVDHDGTLDGIVDIQDIKSMLREPHEELRVSDVETRGVPRLHPDQPIADALPLFFRSDLEVLPVVDAQGRLVGELHERDVVGAYNREVLRKDALLARIESGPADSRHVDYFELPPGQVMRSVKVTGSLVGRSLKQLQLPRRYHCTVLAVIVLDPTTGERRRMAARANLMLKEGDRLVVVGPEDDVTVLCAEKVDDDETVEITKG